MVCNKYGIRTGSDPAVSGRQGDVGADGNSDHAEVAVFDGFDVEDHPDPVLTNNTKCNAPVPLCALYWRSLASRGIIAGSIIGQIASITFIILGQYV